MAIAQVLGTNTNGDVLVSGDCGGEKGDGDAAGRLATGDVHGVGVDDIVMAPPDLSR